jgi:hypothetical protein
MFTTIPETRAQIIARHVNAINDAATKLFVQYRDGYAALYWMLWSNPQCTPQEILDALGTSAVDLFIASSKAATHLHDIDPGYVPPQTPWTFTINADGTVTAIAPVIPEQEPEPAPEGGE